MRAPLLLLLAGCDGVFGLDTVSAPRDATADAATCVNGAADVERFDDSMMTPCPWGFFDHMGFDWTIANGAISLMPMSNFPGAQAGCGSYGFVEFSGFGQFIELAAIGSGNSYLFFRITWPDNTTISYVTQTGNGLEYGGPGGPHLGTVTFDAGATRFFRLRPDGQSVVAEYSADARTWSLIGRDPTPPPPTVKPEFEYGTPAPGEPNPTAAVLAGINACP